MLEFLVRRAGEVHSKREILAGVWEFDFDGDPNIVEVYVAPAAPQARRAVRCRHDHDGARRRLPAGRAVTLAAGARSAGGVTAVATAAIVVVLVAVGWGLVVNHRRELTDNLERAMAEVADGVAAEVACR